ncbi:MAG: InlB B-repeat-containing protein [Clostridiales bacterium]|nr:InlB B-repeat-containing protein [Clostridiales bacterium]
MRKRISVFFIALVLALTAGLAVACSDVKVDKGEKTFSVTYYYNYGGAPNGGVYRTDKVKANVAASKPSNPTRGGGYTFDYWTTDAAGNSSYKFETPVGADLNLYAQWRELLPDVKLTGIQATVTKQYVVGDTFNKTDITVVAKYSDGNEVPVTDFTYTAPDMTTAGDKTITVSHGGMDTTVTITVADPDRALTGITATLKDSAKRYFVGGTFDKADVTVTAAYSDDTNEEVTAFQIVTAPDMTTAGDKVITVSYGGKTAQVTITVETVVVSRIAITTQPTKLVYTVGEALDLTGMVVTAYYNNGTSAVVAVADCEVTGYSPTGVREQTLTVTFGGKKATFKVTVKQAAVQQFDVNFNANIAAKFADQITDMPETVKVDKNSTVIKPDAPTLKGFTFDGDWYKDSACTAAWDFENDVVTAGVTLYAKWTAKTYTVSYVLNDGTNGNNPSSITADGNDVTLAPATRDYYTFIGWFTAQTGGTKVEKLGYDSIPANAAATEIKLYARFTANTYDITYDLGTSDEYTATLVATAPKKYTYGTTTTLPDVDDVTVTTKAGIEVPYVFMHWYVQGDETKTEVDNTAGMNGNKTFVALIEQKTTYKFTFDYNHDHKEGGNVTGREFSRNIVEGEKAIYRDLTTQCNRPGYTFGGWYEDNDTFTKEYDFDTPVTAPKTIYAKWTEINYTIVYSGAGVTTTDPTTYKVTDTATTLNTKPTLAEGYYFDGWFFDSAYGEAATTLDENMIDYAVDVDGVMTITVYAKSGNEYTVKFNANVPQGATGLTGKPADATVVYGNAITAPTANPNLADYAFSGWFTAATCDCEEVCTHAWDFENLLNNTTATFDEAHTFNLYARWYKKAASGRYLVGGFNGWGDFEHNDASKYLTAVTGTDKDGKATEWKVEHVKLALATEQDDTYSLFKFIDYNKSTNKVTWLEPYDVNATVRPAAAMSIELTRNGEDKPENYKVKDYNVGENDLWTIEFGTNEKGENYITLTLEGFIGWRDIDSDKSGEEYAPDDSFELENGQWYLTGNFTGWFNQTNEWSTKNEAKAYNRGTTYMFTNVYLKKYDEFKIMGTAGWYGLKNTNFTALGTPIDLMVGGNDNNIKLNTIENGYYNIVFSCPANGNYTLTINKYVHVDISLKAGSNIYVGDRLNNDESTKELFTVVPDGGTATTEYTVVQSTAAAGENVFTIIYKGGVFKFTYTAKTPQITSISVKTAPTKKWYFVGDALSTTGLEVNLVYDKTSLNTTTTDASLFDFEYEFVGRTSGELRLGNTVTVTVKLKADPTITATFSVTVLNKVTSIEVTKNPTTMPQYVGDKLNTAGMEVTVYFNGGKTLSAKASGTPTTTPANGATLTADDDKITVSYKQYQPDGCTLTMPTCKTEIALDLAEPQITSVDVAGNLDTSTYKVGQKFSAAGLSFTATKENGNTVSLTAADMTFTISDEYANAENKFIKAGTGIAVAISYGTATITGKTSVTVNAENVLTSITVNTDGLEKPHAAGFVAGDALSVDGIVVTPVYNEGIGDDVAVVTGNAVSNYTVTPAIDTELTVGEKTITVKYNNMTATFTITVVAREITGIKVSGTAAQQYLSSKFNASGLTFKAQFNDDTEEEVPASNVTFECKESMSGSGTFTVAGDFTMTAKYEGRTCTFAINVENNSRYTVSFNVNIAGTGKVPAGMPADTTAVHNTKLTAPEANPTLKGYTFDGWYKEAACTTVWDFDVDTVMDNTTIYAKWTSKTYTIIYYVDGKLDGTPATYEATDNLFPELELATPSKEGYEFSGWCKQSGLTDTPIHHMTYARLPENDGDGSVPQTINLYAKFAVNKYAVKFIVDGDEVEDYEQSVDYNGNAVKPATDPTINHYKFAFWSIGEREDTTATEFAFATTAITADVTLYAHWTAINYAIDYKLNGGTNNAANPATYSIADPSPKALANPTAAPAGQRFKEWQYNGTKVTGLTHGMLPTAETGKIVITAVFETVTYYTVSFDLNYDVAAGVDKITTVQVEKGNPVAEPADPERQYWTFKWWYVDGDATESEYTFGDEVVGDLTLKAKWERQTVKVSFNLNYGTPATVIETTVNRGECAVVPEAEIPTRDGYKLLGWYTEAACSNEWNFATKVVTGRTLYAKWQKIADAHIVIGEESHELTDNSAENVDHAVEYMLERLELSKNDKVTFTVKNATATLKVDGGAHGIALVNGSTTTLNITADGTYSFYLYKVTTAEEVWTIYASYAEYVDYFYLVGTLPDNDDYKWATVNPAYRLEDGTMTLHLVTGNAFKLAHANDDMSIRWGGEVLSYDNVVSGKDLISVDSDRNIVITKGGDYTISLVDGEITITAENLEETKIENCYVAGDINGWNAESAAHKFAENGEIEVYFTAGQTFKIVYNGAWLGYTSMTVIGEQVEDAKGNDHNIKVKETGTYKLVFDGSKLTVTKVVVEAPSIAVGKYIVLGNKQLKDLTAADKFEELTATDTNQTEYYKIEFEITADTLVRVWNQASATAGDYVAFSELHINGVKQTSAANPTLPAGIYTVHYKVYTDWVRMEFVKEATVEKTTELIGTKVVLTGTDNQSITLYLADANGKGVTLSEYKMWAWGDAGNLLADDWNARPTVTANMTAQAALGDKISFKFTKGSAESSNLEGIRTGKTYVVTIGANNQLTIKEYVGA